MKNLLLLLALLYSVIFYSQKKYTTPKTLKNYLPLKELHITARIMILEKVLLEALILLMEQNAITINFQISKNVF